MSDIQADTALCEKVFSVLEHELGPVETLRFLAVISRKPFDYQSWREQRFDGMSLADILTQSQTETKMGAE